MLELLKNSANLTRTQNGAVTYNSSLNDCVDLFFKAGAMRKRSEKDIAKAVIRAYTESPEITMKIIFYARDVRGGLGERRFFRCAVKTLAHHDKNAVVRNIAHFATYGRFDDLCALLGTPCETEASGEISRILRQDIASMKNGGKVSLIAKWLPSVNASSKETVRLAKRLAGLIGMNDAEYRKSLSALRRYCDILENRLRVKDYTFDYTVLPSRASLKYRKAFIRNDGKRYSEFLSSVASGKAKMNTSGLFPYDIVRACTYFSISDEERCSLDTAWRELPVFGENSGNAIAVIDCSGSMTSSMRGVVRPIDAALSLGIYFAEHNKGRFGGHFITFSKNPQLIEIKGGDIVDKVRYCSTFDEVANTDIERVFELILNTAINNELPQKELPETVYIISDMEFDHCVEGGENLTLFQNMKLRYEQNGYRIPNVVFWNVNSFGNNFPVTMSETGTALVSGFSPVLFDAAISNDISPIKMMYEILASERYADIA